MQIKHIRAHIVHLTRPHTLCVYLVCVCLLQTQRTIFRLEPTTVQKHTRNWFRTYFTLFCIIQRDWNRKRAAKPFMCTSDLRSNKASRQELAHSNTNEYDVANCLCDAGGFAIRLFDRASACVCLCFPAIVFYTGRNEILWTRQSIWKFDLCIHVCAQLSVCCVASSVLVRCVWARGGALSKCIFQ